MPENNRRPATVRLARWSATHPWRAIAGWLALVAVCVAVGGFVGTNQAADVDMGVGESGRATEMLHDAGLDRPAVESVMISAPDGAQFDLDAGYAAAGELTAQLGALPEVGEVSDPIRGPNSLLVEATMTGDAEDAQDDVDPIIDAVESVSAQFPQVHLDQAGDGSVEKGVMQTVTDDLAKAELLSLPITLIILLVAFGAIIAAGVPVLLAASAVGTAMGLSALASHVMPATDSTNSMILLMGMAVGVDYSLFYVKRHREERARGLSKADAVEIAAATSGHSVIVSGAAVLVSMAGLYLADDAIIGSLATGAIIVVAVAVVGSLTVLPAMLVKFKMDKRWIRLPGRRSESSRMASALLRPALRRPGLTLVVGMLAMLALAAPALGMKLSGGGVEDLPASIPAVASYNDITTEYPQEAVAHDIVVRAPASEGPAVEAAFAALSQQVQGNPLFAASTGVSGASVSEDGRTHVFELATPFSDDSDEAKDAVRELRSELIPATLGSVDGATVAVGGSVADNIDWTDQLSERLPYVVGFVLALTFLMMLVTFRAPMVALTSLVVNLLSVASAFGVMVLVFQHSWAEGILDFESTGSLQSWLPLFVFAVLFGLSMDYHVFVVSRIREAAERGLSTREAVADGITRSAGVVTSAAVVMVSVFSLFATLSLVDMKQMGVGLASAVLLDAIVVRLLILPSAMILLGRWNWWPGRLGRRGPDAPVPAPAPVGGYVGRVPPRYGSMVR